MEPQTVGEVLKWQPKEPEAPLIGSGIMNQQSRGIMYGRYKSLKSMLAMYLALCIGSGREWLGFPTKTGGGRVLYLQIEMPHRFMKKRLEGMLGAWHKGTEQDQVFIWSEPFIKIDTKEGMSLVAKRLLEVKPDLFIIDPLYKVMTGNILDPNHVRDFLDNLDKLMANHDCSILIISHTRKGVYDEWGSDDLIGSMFLSAWADAVIKVTRKEVLNKNEVPITLTFDVLRHAEEPIDELEVVFSAHNLAFNITQGSIVIPV